MTLYLSQLLIEADDGTMVGVAQAVNLEGLEDFHDCRGQGQGYSHLMAGSQGVGQVFDVQVDAETGIKLSGHY